MLTLNRISLALALLGWAIGLIVVISFMTGIAGLLGLPLAGAAVLMAACPLSLFAALICAITYLLGRQHRYRRNYDSGYAARAALWLSVLGLLCVLLPLGWMVYVTANHTGGWC
jgi:uncharacterized membrane protein YoaK (UPF0700 family)